MQFTKPFKEKIRAGEQTLTFRRWKAPQAKIGGIYKLAPTGGIEVTAVDIIEPNDIVDGDLARSGHHSRSELDDYLDRSTETLYRVEFHYVEPDAMPAREALPMETVIGKLEATDRRSATAWTTSFLEVIRDNPGRRAGDLADSLGWEKAPFKANVRKLKALGLTQSLDVGYRLTPLGQDVTQTMTETQ